MTVFPSILIVEDDRDLRSIYRDYLDGPYRVLTASTFEEAVACLNDDIDIVLLDRKLPDKSGPDLLPHIDQCNAMVAMVTAVEPDVDIIDMAIDDYLTKPVSREELRDTVDHLLTTKSYSSTMTEYLSLVKKRAVLRAEKSSNELNAHTEVIELENRIDQLEREADTLRDELLQYKPHVIFADP